jgi:hypothetical protein
MHRLLVHVRSVLYRVDTGSNSAFHPGRTMGVNCHDKIVVFRGADNRLQFRVRELGVIAALC